MCEVVSSQKGKPKLVINGYMMCKDKNRNDIYYWRCDKRRTLNCRGCACTVLVSGEHKLRRHNDHNHPPSYPDGKHFRVRMEKRIIKPEPYRDNILAALLENENNCTGLVSDPVSLPNQVIKEELDEVFEEITCEPAITDEKTSPEEDPKPWKSSSRSLVSVTNTQMQAYGSSTGVSSGGGQSVTTDFPVCSATEWPSCGNIDSVNEPAFDKRRTSAGVLVIEDPNVKNSFPSSEKDAEILWFDGHIYLTLYKGQKKVCSIKVAFEDGTEIEVTNSELYSQENTSHLASDVNQESDGTVVQRLVSSEEPPLVKQELTCLSDSEKDGTNSIEPFSAAEDSSSASVRKARVKHTTCNKNLKKDNSSLFLLDVVEPHSLTKKGRLKLLDPRKCRVQTASSCCFCERTFTNHLHLQNHIMMDHAEVSRGGKLQH